MKELNSAKIDKELMNILKEAKVLKFNEIIIEEDKGIIFTKYNGKLITLPYEFKGKLNKNKLINYYKSLNTNSDIKNRFIETYLYENEKEDFSLFFRLYIYFNRNKIVMNFKLFNNFYFDIKKYFLNINDNKYINKPKKIKTLFNNIVNPFIPGIYLISSQTVNIRKNFLYSLVEMINKIEQKSKILLYEKITEKIINSENSLIYQLKLNNIENLQNDDRFINPDVIVIEEEFNEKILLTALNLANEGRKIFLTTNYTDFNSLQNYIEKTLEKNNLIFNYFLENFKLFLVFKSTSNNVSIESIYNPEDIKPT